MVGIRELEFAAEGVVFFGLGVFKRLVGGGETGGGVGHGSIQPEGVEFVSEIVVFGNVPAGGFDGVRAFQVPEPVDDFE